MKKFSECLKDLRMERNIKQSDLADFCNLSTRQIIRYEQDVSEPTLSVLIKLADYFEISLDRLCGREKL